jgi:hypothetical protein
MADKIGLIFYSDNQLLVELFLGKEEKNLLPGIEIERIGQTREKSLINKENLDIIRQKVRERYGVDIDSPELLDIKGMPFLVVGDWEAELPSMTKEGNRLLWTDLNELPGILTFNEDLEGVKGLREHYCKVMDIENKVALGIARKDEAQKFNLKTSPL